MENLYIVNRVGDGSGGKAASIDCVSDSVAVADMSPLIFSPSYAGCGLGRGNQLSIGVSHQLSVQRPCSLNQ